MTIFYTTRGGRCTSFGGFANLLFIWKGSIFKLIWPDLLIFLCAYYACSVTYRFLLNDHQQRLFEQISNYCEKYGNLIPMSFVLGFYVSLVVSRWWAQYKCIPWIDTLASSVNSYLQGSTERERLYRRTIMRYVCLSITQCFTLISTTVKKRFPTLDHYIEAGLLMEDEKLILIDITSSIPKHQVHWIPMIWASDLIMKARDENICKNDTFTRSMIDEINKIKAHCIQLLNFDRICVPLVYTQVVSLAVYSFFFSCIMGRQWLYPKRNIDDGRSEKFRDDDLDLVIPVFTILQFLFYMGWLKVAEALVNPFGEDDNDFELQWMVDRSLLVSYLIVDEMHQETPPLKKDIYWREIIPTGLPHTKASLRFPHLPPPSSTSNLSMTREEAEIIYCSRPIGNAKPKVDKENEDQLQCPSLEASPQTRRAFARNFRRKYLNNSKTYRWKLNVFEKLFCRNRNRKSSGSISSRLDLKHSVLNDEEMVIPIGVSENPFPVLAPHGQGYVLDQVVKEVRSLSISSDNVVKLNGESIADRTT